MRSGSRANWWILSLALLAVAVGLLLLQVARSKPDESSRTGRAGVQPLASAPAPGSGGQGGAARAEGRDGRGWRRGAMGQRPRIDRARLARLLARGSRSGEAMDPGAWGPESDRDGVRGQAGGDGLDGAEDPVVWPLTAKGIKGAMRARIAEIKECYDGWLAADDELGGKLVLAFTIEADLQGEHARISNAEIQHSTLAHPGLERCVLVMAESLHFEPPHEGKITVRYPFRFRPAEN